MIEHSLQPSSEHAVATNRSSVRIVASVFGCAVLMAFMFVSPLVPFIPAALFHCALRNGRRAALGALLLAVSLAAVVGVPASLATPAAKFELGGFVAVILAIALPALAAIPMVERAEPFGRVLAFLTGGAVIGLFATQYAVKALLNFSLLGYFDEAQKGGIELLRAMGMPPPEPRALHVVSMLMPGHLIAYTILMFVLSLLMLGRLKIWREHAKGNAEVEATYLFRKLSLPEWLLLFFVAGGVTPLVSGMAQKVGANVLLVVAFLYMLQGLAIFRAVMLAANASAIATMMGWMLLAFLTITRVGPFLLALAGLFDPFFDFRHFKRKDDSHESHTD